MSFDDIGKGEGESELSASAMELIDHCRNEIKAACRFRSLLTKFNSQKKYTSVELKTETTHPNPMKNVMTSEDNIMQQVSTYRNMTIPMTNRKAIKKNLLPETSNLSRQNISDVQYIVNPLWTRIQKEQVSKMEEFEPVKKHVVMKPKKTKTDEETQTDITLSSLKCSHQKEQFVNEPNKCTSKYDDNDMNTFLVQIPKSFDTKLLVGGTISNVTDTNLEVNCESFDIKVSRDETRPFLTMIKLCDCHYNCRSLEVLTNVVVQDKPKLSDKMRLMMADDNTNQFPNKLETNVDNGTQKKLKEAKKKKLRGVQETIDGNDGVVLNLLDDDKYSDKKNKRERQRTFKMKETPVKIFNSTFLGMLESTPNFNYSDENELTVIEKKKTIKNTNKRCKKNI